MAIRVLFDVDRISDVLRYFDELAIYRADTEGGVYSELTGPGTRVGLIPEQTKYYYYDDDGDGDKWYKASYHNSITDDFGELGGAVQGSDDSAKVGYSFGNYKAAPNTWGKIVTADDMRYTYLWGVDATASDVAETDFEDEQFDFFVEEALADFETELTIDIRKRIYKTNPSDTLEQSPEWREGVDYTDEEDPYSFDPLQWQNYGFLQLKHAPVISVERAILNNVVGGEVLDLKENGWLRITKKTGQLHFYPTSGVAYGPFAVGVLPWRLYGGRYPQGYEIDYTTGYKTSDFVPKDLRSVIGKWACIKCLASIGDGLLAGFSSQSVSLDGLSESFSSTQSATSAYFGARIKQYQDEIKDWLTRNRHKYGAIPMSFVGY
jgi:hypothetical protein